MLSSPRQKWRNLSDFHRFLVDLSLLTGILLGFLLGLMGDATQIGNKHAEMAFGTFIISSMAVFSLWLLFPIFSGIQAKLANGTRVIGSTVFGIIVSSASIYLLYTITKEFNRYTMGGSTPLFLYLSVLLPSAVGSLVLLLYYRYSGNSRPLELNIHIFLAAAVLLTAVPSALAGGYLQEDLVSLDSKGGNLLQDAEKQVCKSTVELQCNTADQFDIPEACEGRALGQIREEYRIENGTIYCG